jgi:hypothetical protein
MLSIALLTEKHDEPVATEIASGLTNAGFRVSILKFSTDEDSCEEFNNLEDSSAFVAILSPSQTNNLLLVSTAYLIGRQKNVWILSDEIDALPLLLRRASYLSLRETNPTNALVEQIRKTLRIEAPPFEVMHDLNRLTAWLVESPGRITGLSSKNFERLVFHLLADLGLRYETTFRSRSNDLIFSEPDGRNLLLVEMKNYLAGRKVGVGAIERSSANALSLGCNFTVIISANEFTPAAIEFAKLSCPPVWLLGRDSLEYLIREKHEPKSTFRKNTGRLFRWLLSKQTDSERSNYPEFNNMQLLPHQSTAPPEPSKGHLYRKKELFRREQDLNCEVFLSFAKAENEGVRREHIVELIGGLEDSGFRVWHDIATLSVGQQCRQLSDVATAVRRSNYVFLFIEPHGEHSMKSLNVCQTVASEVSKTPFDRLKVFVIGTDNPWNRLQLPAIFHESTFLNPAETDWQALVYDLCQQVSDNIKTSDPSKE